MEKNPMKQPHLLVLLGLIGIGSISLLTGRADETADKAAAVKSTETWLGLIDSRKYGESWDEAAELFKKHVSREQWKTLIDATRSPLGKLVSRKMVSSEYSKTLPGAPDGEYVVIQVETSFENKKAAVETLASMKDKDGLWRVSGYFVK
jgi:uncharacterized protein DUF4019